MTAMPNIAAPYPIVIVGHVDHGKSTLTGRLLHDTGSISPARVEAARAASQRRGKTMEWAFLLDGFQAERDRAITIDTARIRFRSRLREYTIIDAPGHKEFIKNMITGAASAQSAVLVIDVAAGLAEQTTRHAHLLQLLGIGSIIVAINKMDTVGYDHKAFENVAADIRDYLAGLGITPERVLPIAARAGENIVGHGDAMPWYDGPTLIECLDAMPEVAAVEAQPLRMPIQDVYEFGGTQSIIGRVESGRLKIGDDLIIQPSSRAARVTGLAGWQGDPGQGAPAGQSVAITLDAPQPVQRGEVVATLAASLSPVHSLRASVFWFGEQPLRLGANYILKAHTARYPVTVTAIEAVVDSATLASAADDIIPQAGIGRVLLESSEPMVLETFANNPRLGRFVLLSGFETVGGGTVSDVAVAPPVTANIFPTASQV
ncbi:MAG: GTP-binding protein, partial [Alphaproteobacteria bacterium]